MRRAMLAYSFESISSTAPKLLEFGFARRESGIQRPALLLRLSSFYTHAKFCEKACEMIHWQIHRGSGGDAEYERRALR